MLEPKQVSSKFQVFCFWKILIKIFSLHSKLAFDHQATKQPSQQAIYESDALTQEIAFDRQLFPLFLCQMK